MNWHLCEEDLYRYATGRAASLLRWSAEAHLASCLACRQRLTILADPHVVERGWDRLDAELDAPSPGPVERLVTRIGVPENTARLLAATPSLRWSWVAALASTVTLTAVLANVAAPVVFLGVAPLLPLVGVAVSYSPRADPTYEITVVMPTHRFRLLLLRCAAVLAVTTAVSAVACLALPEYGLAVLAWFVPALALTLLTLVATPFLGPDFAAAAVGTGWAALVLLTLDPATTGSVLFAPAGQLAAAVAAVFAALALGRLRPAFDTSRTIDRAARGEAGRMP